MRSKCQHKNRWLPGRLGAGEERPFHKERGKWHQNIGLETKTDKTVKENVCWLMLHTFDTSKKREPQLEKKMPPTGWPVG